MAVFSRIASNTRGIVVVRIVTGRTIKAAALAIRTYLPYTTRCANFVGGHELPRLTFETKGRTWNRRFFLARTRFACGLFGLVGVIVFRAFRAVRLPLFRLIQPSVAGQTKRGTVFRLVFSTAAIFALGSTRVCLVTSTLAQHTTGFVGNYVFQCFFSSWTSVAKLFTVICMLSSWAEKAIVA